MNRQSKVFGFNTTLPSDLRGPRLLVLLTDNATEFYAPRDIRLPTPYNALDLPVMAEASIGEWLDTLTSDPAAGDTPIEIICGSQLMETWKARARADDDAILEYAAWKGFWSWRLEGLDPELGAAECVRLGVHLPTMRRLLELEAGTGWNLGTPTPFAHPYRALPGLLKTQREKRLRGGRVLGADPLQVILGSPRYEGVRAHLEKARAFLRSETPDLPNSAKEAVCAVEALAKLVCGRPNDSLGDLLKSLRGRKGADPALIKGLEGLWGYTSSEPAIRHGGTADLDLDQARLTVSLSESSISYLLRLDIGEPAAG